MRYLGLDLGTRTLGISMSDVTRTIATSFKTIKFPEAEYETLIEPLKDIVNEYQIGKIVLGLPKNMNNNTTMTLINKLAFCKAISEINENTNEIEKAIIANCATHL